MAVLVVPGMGLSLGPEPTRLRQVVEPFSTLVETPHVFEFRTKSDAALTDWALGRFQQAGLELPRLIIAFHDDKKPCHGNLGLHRSGTPALIDICGFNWDRFVVAARKTILHELAHAWADHALTQKERESFLRVRGLTTWGDEKTKWEARGTEQAAEIVAWALLEQGPFITAISDAHPLQLARAYLALTGELPPRESEEGT